MWQVYQNKANWYFHHKALNTEETMDKHIHVASYHLRENIQGGKLSQLQEKTPFAGKV